MPQRVVSRGGRRAAPPAVGAGRRLEAETSGFSHVNAFADNFEDPARLAGVLTDPARARAFVTEVTGIPWYRAVAEGAARIAGAQLRRRLGRPMDHPTAPVRHERRPAAPPLARTA